MSVTQHTNSTSSAVNARPDRGRVSQRWSIGAAAVIAVALLYVTGSAAGDCPWDLTGDGQVSGMDLAELLESWGPCADCENCPADVSGDCVVNGADLGSLLGNWGQCPGSACPGSDDACNAVYVYDTCATSNAYGFHPGGVIAWAQRYDAGAGDTITNMATAYGTAKFPGWSGVSACDPVGYALMTVADDGGPGTVIWQGEAQIQGDAIASDQSQILDVPDVAVAGEFYLVAWVEHEIATFPAPMDESDPEPHLDAVWYLGDQVTFDAFDPADTGTRATMADTELPAVWWLRGNQ